MHLNVCIKIYSLLISHRMYSNLLISSANTYSRFRLSRPTSAAVSAANTRVERNAETTKSRKTALQPRDEATLPTGSPPMAAPTCPAKPKAPPAAPRASAWVSRTAIPHMALAPYTQAPALATATYSRAAEDSSGRAHRVAIETTRPLVQIMLVQTVNCIAMQAKDSVEVVVTRLKHARGWVSEAEADGKVLIELDVGDEQLLLKSRHHVRRSAF